MSISIPTAHKTSVKLSYGELRPVVEWCDRNCTSEWRYMEDPHGDMYNSWIFFFENERDFVAFELFLK